MADCSKPDYVIPQWPVASNIRAAFTTRAGGFSQSPCDGFNLGLHVNDNADHVNQNRQLLIESLALPDKPFYLNQVHGTDVLCVDENRSASNVPTADACWSQSQDRVIAIMTADCLPVLFASECGTVIAGAHAGWRGLAGGVLENTVSSLPVAATELIAWLGPAIGPDKFEVGAEVKSFFTADDPLSAKHFRSAANNKYMADLYGLATDRLNRVGVSRVFGGDQCTYTNADRYFSHRRDHGKTGRMAALIWKE